MESVAPTSRLITPAARARLPLLEGRLWRHRSGERSRWPLANGVLEVAPGSGDVYPDVSLPAFQLHVEFWLPSVPGAQGQDRSNSGVYLDGRFEVQLLSSAGEAPKTETCGAIYEVRAADHDACGAPESWQTLDVAYRRLHAGARVSAFLNGVLIHNHVELTEPTSEAFLEEPRPVVMLQDHGARVRFRNLWVIASR